MIWNTDVCIKKTKKIVIAPMPKLDNLASFEFCNPQN